MEIRAQFESYSRLQFEISFVKIINFRTAFKSRSVSWLPRHLLSPGSNVTIFLRRHLIVCRSRGIHPEAMDERLRPGAVVERISPGAVPKLGRTLPHWNQESTSHCSEVKEECGIFP